MAHTRSQDLEARFNTLHSNFTETQQEVRHINDNILCINQKTHSSIATSVAISIKELRQELKQDITTQLESISMTIFSKMHIPADIPLSDPPLHTEGETSSHSQNFQPHHFQCDLCLLHVDVTKFDGSNPMGWVTQMEHYFSLYGITDELAKLRYGVLHINQERWQWRKKCPLRVCGLDTLCGRAL
jgi:hypothetical protein